MPIPKSGPVSVESEISGDTVFSSVRSQTAAAAALNGKRVAMLLLSFYPEDTRPRRTVEVLLKCGVSVDLVCLAEEGAPKREQRDGLNIYRVPIQHRRAGKLAYLYEYTAFILVSLLLLAFRSWRRRYDAVYVNNMPDVLVASALVPKLLGAKVILDMHDPMPELMTTIFGLDSQSLGVRLLKTLERWSMAFSDLVITVNRACDRIFTTRSCPPEKMLVVMNSPDEEIFPFRPVAQSPAVRDPNKEFIIMYHGSLVERNGLDLAVEALARVRNRVPNAKLRIYGGKSAYLQRVLASVREKSLEPAVEYLGSKTMEEIVIELDRCDVGVIPNQRNAFTEINTPTRIFEYLTMGKPVIAPSTMGIQDYFDENSLLFFEAGNPDDLADKLAQVYAQPRATDSITRRGQAVYAKHTWDTQKTELLSRVAQLLG